MLDKFKAKRNREAKMSGVNMEDGEFDTLMEEISEKWEEAQTAKDFLLTNKKKSDVDRAAGEEIRAKACEQLGETNKRKGETGESQPKKTRRSSRETLDFLKEKLASQSTRRIDGYPARTAEAADYHADHDEKSEPGYITVVV